MSISDQRWQSDVTRLAKVVAIDMPGSGAERTLRWVQWAVSLALFLSVGGTAGIVAYSANHPGADNLFNDPEHSRQFLSLAWSAVTFVVISCCVMLLLYFAQLVDAGRRIYIHAAVAAGVTGTLVSFLLLRVGESNAPVQAFFESTITAIAVLVLAALSGFKAR